MGISADSRSNSSINIGNLYLNKECTVNEKKAKAIRKQIDYHPTQPRGYVDGHNSKKGTGTLTIRGSRDAYKQAKKLAEQINERHTA